MPLIAAWEPGKGLYCSSTAVSVVAVPLMLKFPQGLCCCRTEFIDRLAGRYRIVQGRWPGSRALEFVNVSKHMPIEVGLNRDWPQITLTVWVRIDRLDAPYQ